MGWWFKPANLQTEQFQVAARERTKSPPISPAEAEPAAEFFTQRKRPESGRFRLLVDRQLKGSYTTSEAAEAAGLAIKEGYPIVQVTVYDAVDGINKAIELSKN
jgi:hypothetical protein